jgi:CheY-like chemotaxis protein
MIERQLVQLVRLVDDLLDFSRISLHKLDLQRHPIDLAQIVGQAASAVQPFVNSRNQHLILSVPEDRYYLNADPVRLTQIFNNLLHNASKFTGHGGQIILSVRDEGNEVIVYVTDNGIGIPPERLADVFEPFVQLKNAPDNHHGGLGIGLAMVRQLVELHGGNVKAHSKGLGTGSEFVVRLPLLATKPSLNDVTSPGKLSGSSRPLRVLVVDDDEDTADSLTTLLKIDGYDARCAYEGLEALEVGRSFRPHVVLLDIGLPGFSGYDAARRIREQPWGAQLLLIALTGWAQQKDREQSKKAGFDFHFAKPLDPVVLREILEAAAVNDRP